MQYIYVLESKKDGNLYIGCTAGLENRVSEHNRGRVVSTRPRRPFTLVFSEAFEDKYEAFRMERFYKTAKGKKELKIKLSIKS